VLGLLWFSVVDLLHGGFGLACCSRLVQGWVVCSTWVVCKVISLRRSCSHPVLVTLLSHLRLTQVTNKCEVFVYDSSKGAQNLKYPIWTPDASTYIPNWGNN
jgi:hypothetical protein